MIEELSRREAEKLFEKCKFGHLACVLESGEPYLVPINYLFIDGSIYVHTLPGKKLDALRGNGKVCLQVEEIKSDCLWRSAIAFGEFQEIKKREEKLKILLKFSEHFGRLTPVEAMSKENWNKDGIVVFRINIRQITSVAES